MIFKARKIYLSYVSKSFWYLMFTVLLYSFVLVGCISFNAKRTLFINTRNYDIGRKIDVVPVPDPIEIKAISVDHEIYVFQYVNTGCRWCYIVDKSTKEIISWEYLSNSDLCYHILTIKQ